MNYNLYLIYPDVNKYKQLYIVIVLFNQNV